MLFGEKAANRMQYKINEQGADINKLRKQETVKQVAKMMAVYAGFAAASYIATEGVDIGKAWYETKKNQIALNNAAVDLYAQMAHIPYDNKVGVGLGLDAAARGKQVYDMLSPKKR